MGPTSPFGLGGLLNNEASRSTLLGALEEAPKQRKITYMVSLFLFYFFTWEGVLLFP